MPTFAYRALDQTGRKQEGSVAAATRQDALKRLMADGQNVLDLREDSRQSTEDSRGFSFRRSALRLSTLTRQLATLSKSGVPLVQSLNTLIEQTSDPRARLILEDIRASVEGGSSLADAMAKHPRNFPRVMTSMVRVGERGGTVDEVLLQLAELYEKEEALKGEIRSAMAYPALVLVLGLVSATILMIFLVPRLKELFVDAGQTLPLPTRILIGISDLMTGQGWVLLLVAISAVIAYSVWIRSKKAQLAMDRMKLRIPWMGRLIRNVSVARFTRLLGTLTRSGISIVEGIDIVRAAVPNGIISEAIGEMSSHIRSGESVADVMRKTNVFPPMPVQMVAVGEESGHLDQMLLQVAEAYERETTNSARVMISLLAPVLILFVACIVGFIVLSMLLPIFQLSSVIR